MDSETKAVSPAASEPVGYGRDFKLYIAGRAVSVVGDRIALIALVFLIIHLSGSFALALALFYVVRMLPQIVGMAFVGVLVDHFDRRKLLIISDLSRLIVVGAIPVLTALSLWDIYPLVVILYAFNMVFDSASGAMVPDIVPKDRLTGANSIRQSIQGAADLGYAAGGALIFTLGYQLPFYIDAATFLISAALIFEMVIPRPKTGPMPNMAGVLREVVDGARVLLSIPFLKWTSIAFLLAPLGGGLQFVLMPLYAQSSLAHSAGLFGPLHGGAFRFGVTEVFLGMGALLGAYLTPKLAKRFPRGALFGLGLLLMAAPLFALGFTQNIYVAVVVMIITGIGNNMWVICGMTLAGILVPSELRGRVMGARVTGVNLGLAVGSAIGGAMLLVVPYRDAWFIIGALIGVSSLFVFLPQSVRSQR
ncbi:MAG: MFS transporter [Chloroflexota bacterium]